MKATAACAAGRTDKLPTPTDKKIRIHLAVSQTSSLIGFENSLNSLGALGEGTVAFVAVRCGPNPIRLIVFFIVFFQKAKLLQKYLVGLVLFVNGSLPNKPFICLRCPK